MKFLLSKHRVWGFTFIDLLIVVVTATLFAFWFVPQLARPRCCTSCPRIRCTSNLKQTGLALRMFSNDHNDIGLADGSAQQMTDASLLKSIHQSTNLPARLALP
jgi:hypothetical protein